MSQLVRAVGTIPATTARERLAQSEIAKKVRDLSHKYHDSGRIALEQELIYFEGCASHESCTQCV